MAARSRSSTAAASLASRLSARLRLRTRSRKSRQLPRPQQKTGSLDPQIGPCSRRRFHQEGRPAENPKMGKDENQKKPETPNAPNKTECTNSTSTNGRKR